MQRTTIALGLAGVLLAVSYSTAPAAFIVPPAKSVISGLNSNLTDVRWAALLARSLGAKALPMVLARPLGQDSLQLNAANSCSPRRRKN